MALNRNDLETARTKQAVAQDSRNAQLHDELGSLYAMEKNWIPAEQQFPEAVTLKEDSASAHVHYNDGFDDLFVIYYGLNALYRNNGNGTFADVTREAGLI